MSHLLHAPSASPNETASSTAHSFRMRRPPRSAGSIQESREGFERLGEQPQACVPPLEFAVLLVSRAKASLMKRWTSTENGMCRANCVRRGANSPTRPEAQ
jgi:hypothetical protein